MRNLFKAGLALLIAGMLAMSACGSSDKPTGTGGSTGSGGATGTGGSTTDAGGTDVPVGTGGAGGGGAGTGGAGGTANAHQDHLNIINSSTTGGIPVNRPAPVAYDTCKI